MLKKIPQKILRRKIIIDRGAGKLYKGRMNFLEALKAGDGKVMLRNSGNYLAVSPGKLSLGWYRISNGSYQCACTPSPEFLLRTDFEPYIPAKPICEACQLLKECHDNWGGRAIAFLLKQHCTCKDKP